MTPLLVPATAPATRGISVFEVPAPVVPASRLFATDRVEALYWASGDEEIAGAGAAAVLAAAGPGRFPAIREHAAALFASLGDFAAASGSFAPRLFGGFAFQVGGADAPPWTGFGDARFVLPRFRYTRAGDEARLALAVHASEIATDSGREAWLRAFTAAFDALERPAPPAPRAGAPRLAEGNAGAWRSNVNEIVAGITGGRFDKVVAARRVVAKLGAAVAPPAVIDALSRDFPGCARFAFRRGERVFVGATPERLIEKRGRELRTEALAGSIRAGSAEDARRLVASKKDQGEHAFVVRHVVDSLSPLCSALEHAPSPEIRELRDVLHLRTPIAGTLSAPRHVLDVAERLHPTPAVAGTPTAAALDWIAAREPDARGWYAGPVGWFDAAGDGELAVALRSGVLDGAEAHLYAGAGIVRGSDADAELAETRLKLAALLTALEAR